MSTNLAETIPLGLPDFAAPEYEAQPRHIEIVSTRSQRRARPRPIYALIIVGGLFVLFIAQLLMSIVVSNGAYQISSLQTEQRELTQTQNALTEQVNVLSSPQNLTKEAKRLGMGIDYKTPTFLKLDGADSKIIGKEKASSNVDKLGSMVVPNSLVDDAAKAEKDAAKKAAKDAEPAPANKQPASTTASTESSQLPGYTQ